ncbi:MAG TPA: WD40 repeat domain-containing protein [Cyanothece sp. UBA12306]|nr:WD40 repeat domain-containing protein [Cyanothece sp. UBA12306]
MNFKQLHWLEVAEFLALGMAVILLLVAIADQNWLLPLALITCGLILNSLNRIRWQYLSNQRLLLTKKQIKRQISQDLENLKISVAPLSPTVSSEESERRAIARLQENLVSLEQSLNSVVQYLNTQVLPERIEHLEKSHLLLKQNLQTIIRQIEDPAAEIVIPSEAEILSFDDSSTKRLNVSQVTTQLPIVAPTSFVSQAPDIPVWHEVEPLIGHDDAVSCLAISSNGKWLLSGSWDQTLRIWELAKGTLKSQTTAHTQGLLAVVFDQVETSESHYQIATGSFDHTIKLWSVNTEDSDNITLSLEETLTQHTGSVQCLALSNHPLLLVSGSYDQTVKQWKLPKGEMQCSSYDPLGAIYAIAVYSAEELIASAGGDGRVTLWQLGSGKQIGFLAGNVSSVESLAFSLDGEALAAGCVDGTIKLWQLDASRFGAGRPLQPVRTLEAHNGQVKALVFNQEEQLLFSGGADGYVRIWHPSRREAISVLGINDVSEFNPSSILSLALSDDGQLLIAGTADGRVRIWKKAS